MEVRAFLTNFWLFSNIFLLCGFCPKRLPIYKISTDNAIVAHAAMFITLATFKPHMLFTVSGVLTEEGIFRISNIPFDILQIWYSLQGGNIAIWLLLSAAVSSPMSSLPFSTHMS